MANFERHLDGLGEAYRHLNAADMRRLTGSRFYRAGTFTPGAALLQPAGYIRGIADGWRRKVTIFENSPVLEIQSGRDVKLRTGKGELTAAKAILTVNEHLESFGLFRSRPLHIFTYASMTRQLSDAELSVLGGEAAWA